MIGNLKNLKKVKNKWNPKSRVITKAQLLKKMKQLTTNQQLNVYNQILNKQKMKIAIKKKLETIIWIWKKAKNPLILRKIAITK